MILDKITRLGKYLPNNYRDAVLSFLDTISKETPNGEYPINGNNIFARVMSYETKAPELCKIEAHDTYIDIQSTITGVEGIGIFDRDILENISEPYNAEKDVLFFSAGKAPLYTIAVHEGYFAMIFPHEAHRPQTAVDGALNIKKFVIKINKELIENE
jgi:YhcH/YjgK/YiaL family protein